MFSYASTLYGQTVTASDFAIFSGTTQTNVLVEALANGGALVNVTVPFTTTNTEVTEAEEARYENSAVSSSSTSVAKRITVGREADMSLSPNPSGTIKRNKKVNLFGCVASRVPFLAGEKVDISLKRAGSSSATIVRGTLDAKGCYRKPFKVVSSGNATASLKRNPTIGRATTVKSKRLSIKVK